MRSSEPKQIDCSWRRLAVRLGLFCLPLVLALAALEWWAATVPNIYSLKRQRLEAMANDVDTLIIGASSAFHDIQPSLLPGSAFNLGGPFETLYEDDALIRKVLPSLPKLKRVIIQIQYVTLFYRLSATPESWRQYCYQQEWRVPPMELKDWLDSRMWSRLALRTPRYYLDLLAEALRDKLRHGKFALNQPEIAGTDQRGWCPTEIGVKPPSPDFLGESEAKNRMKTHHAMMNASWEMGNLACLDHMLSILRQRNIAVELVTVPVWRTYGDLMNPEYWNETQRRVAERTNNESVRYHSYLTAPQLEPQDFYDVDHLSTRGANRFTRILASELFQDKGSAKLTNLEPMNFNR